MSSKSQKKHAKENNTHAPSASAHNDTIKENKVKDIKEIPVDKTIVTTVTVDNSATSSSADISFLPIFVQRVTPTVVSSIFLSAKGYYETSKAKYPMIATAENNIIKLSTPVIEKVKPTIDGLDQFGCKQLDKIETQVISSKKKFEESIYKPAEQALESTKTFVYNNIVNTKPVNHALEITEYAVDKFLPFQNKKIAEEPESSDSLDVNARFTRLRSKTLDKLKSIQPLSEEKLKSFTHSVSLIEYASKYIDVNHSVEEAKEFVHAPIQKSTEYVKTGVNLVLESNVTKSIESVAIDGYNRAIKTVTIVYNTNPIQRGRHFVQDSVNYVLSSKMTQSVESVAKEGIQKAVGVGKSAITYIPKPVMEKVENTYSIILVKVPGAEKTINTIQSYISPLLTTDPTSSSND